ncbi:MAG: amidohydrolase family protein [Cyclobacteriaceae bacterium]
MKSKLYLVILCSFLFFSCGKDNSPTVEDQEQKFSEVIISSPQEIRNVAFAIVNVNVIAMIQTDEVLTEQTVIVDGGLISWIGPSANATIPAGTQVIDAANKGYLIPGMADMHFHRSTGSDLFLFTANGVTVAREMWGSKGMLDIRDQILDEKLDLPQFFVASPGMNGAGGAWEQFTPPVTDPNDARSLVKQYKEEGFDFVKVYNKLEPSVYAAIIDEAELQGIRVIGHVPAKVSPETVMISGQATTEHFLGFGYFASSKNTVSNGVLNESKVAELATMSVENNVRHVATIEVDVHSPSDIAEVRNSEEYNYISDHLKNTFENGFHQGSSTAEQALINNYQIIDALKAAGSKLLLGTDAGFGYILPGFSVHDELAHFVQAGLSNYEALETATVHPAEFLEMADVIGTVEAGKRADLVLLESNPLEDIANVQDRAGVVLRGTWLSEKVLREEVKK